MNEPINPGALARPAANYSHAVRSIGSVAMLHTSGVVPTRPDGTVPDTLAEQAEVVWSNLQAILADGGFAVSDVVSVTTFVVHGQDLGVVMAARDRAMAGHRPASTLVPVPALARPEWLMEIALVAAR
jgi:2-iminobutanoate/2-iminopropanoate deaminase